MNLSQLMFLAVLCSPAAATSLAAADPTPAAQGLPPEAQKAVTEYDAQVIAVQKKADLEIEAIRKRVEQEVLAAREECRKALKVVQDTYTKAGKLDEAVAVRDRIASLPVSGEVLPDPGSLVGYNNHIGKSLYFETTGTTINSVYGDGIYTTDSKLASAAVHAGVLKDGQKGVVKVTILPGQNSYASAARNGVTSSSWFSWAASYKVEPAYVAAAKPANPAKP